MKNKKIILSTATGFLLLGTAFGAIFGSVKEQEYKANIQNAKSIETCLKEYQDKYLITDDSKVEEITSKAIKEVGNFAQKLYKENKIESYVINKESVVINNNCGVTMVFSPSLAGTYENPAKTVQNYIRILPNQMIYSEASHVTEGYPDLPSGINDDGELIPNIAEEIADEFEHVLYDEKDLLQDIPLDKEFMQKLGPNQLVIMLGHGTYVEGYHSTLNTGRQFSWKDYQNDATYREDVKNGLIIDTSGGEAFTTRYVDKYVGDLTNTFIYFGECESAKDSALANSFLYKGAAALVANTEAISMRYGDMMQYTTLKYMMTKYPGSDRYYTAKEALDKAKELYGECDPGLLVHSRPTFFGDENFSLDKARIAPVYKMNYEYTGETIEFVKPGIGFHVKDTSFKKGINAGYYPVEVVLEEGYKWPEGSEESGSFDITVTIDKKAVNLEEIVAPQPLIDGSTDGRNVNLFKKGESDIGTFEYYLEGSDDFYWTDKIPYVNKPGTYTIGWRFVGDDNHKDLGGNNGFQYIVTVKAAPSYSTFPAWAIILLCVVGAGAVIALTVLTGKKVKKLSQEREENNQ